MKTENVFARRIATHHILHTKTVIGHTSTDHNNHPQYARTLSGVRMCEKPRSNAMSIYSSWIQCIYYPRNHTRFGRSPDHIVRLVNIVQIVKLCWYLLNASGWKERSSHSRYFVFLFSTAHTRNCGYFATVVHKLSSVGSWTSSKSDISFKIRLRHSIIAIIASLSYRDYSAISQTKIQFAIKIKLSTHLFSG